MDISIVYDFLEKLASNNNREWFNKHRDEYEKARLEFEKLVAAAIDRISLFDETIWGVQVKNCTYRIYRDTRFSPDKTPYKVHMGAYINAKGKKSDYCGYYIHLQPGNSLLAGGSYCPSSELLKALRKAVYSNIDEYRSIVEDPKFKDYFPQIGYNFLKTAPKGFPKDFEHMDYLKCKEYCCDCAVPDSVFTSPNVLDRIEEISRQLKRFLDFINYSIDELNDLNKTYNLWY
ncbi:MAG: DUF2461 domain-containing protein [Mediterranea sp.]|nr:DUF2461 domain-containing protein [Mediterranea sp.]